MVEICTYYCLATSETTPHGIFHDGKCHIDASTLYPTLRPPIHPTGMLIYTCASHELHRLESGLLATECSPHENSHFRMVMRRRNRKQWNVRLVSPMIAILHHTYRIQPLAGNGKLFFYTNARCTTDRCASVFLFHMS